MDDARAMEVLEKLLDGVHPMTGEPLQPGGVLEEPQVLLALYRALLALHRKAKPQQAPPGPQEILTRKGRPNAGRPWTESDDVRLRAMAQAGVSVDRICARLQRRPEDTQNRMLELGISPQAADPPRKPVQPGKERAGAHWEPEEDAWLRQMFDEGRTVREMAATLHRSRGAIHARLEKLQLIANGEDYPEPQGESTRSDKEDLRYRFLHGETVPQLAARYGQSEQTVRARLFYMGLGGRGPRVLPERRKDE